MPFEKHWEIKPDTFWVVKSIFSMKTHPSCRFWLSPESQGWISVITSYTCSSWKAKGGFAEINQSPSTSGEKCSVALPCTHFSNHRVRFVVWRIIFRRFGEFSSLSSFVHTLPTSSEGCTALAMTKQEAKCSEPIKTVTSVSALMDYFSPNHNLIFHKSNPTSSNANHHFWSAQVQKETHFYLHWNWIILKKNFQIRNLQRSEFNFLKGQENNFKS